jgi:hypothetical protein
MANLIICPVGMEMPHDPRWKKEDHWRWTHNKRNYETLLVVYNDFEPEPGSYDHLIRMKGNKFQIVRNVAHDIPLGKYNYIACVDDDLITERTFVWSSEQQYIEETVILEAPVGTHQLQVENVDPALGTFTVEQIKLDGITPAGNTVFEIV